MNFATSQASDAGLASQVALRAAEAAILDSLEVSSEDVKRLRRLPQRLPDGTYNPAWLAARRWRLTAGRFVSVRRVGQHRRLAKEWLDHWWYRGQERLNHKINRSFDFEDRTLEKYQRLHPGEQVEQVGLLVHPALPWLGASPDGVSWDATGATAGPGHLIEIKSCRSLLGKKSPAWHQVQGAMAIASGAYQCKVTRCKIIDPVETYHICFDETWWEKFLKRLKAFYFGVFWPMAARRILMKAR